MSLDRRVDSPSKNEKVGLLFGYHKEMYKDKEKKPSLVRQCCAIYCAKGSLTSWSISFSIGIMIIGMLCTLYGYYLPTMYLSLSPEIDANMTLVDKNENRFEKEAKSLKEVYNDGDVFIISGLVILFVGGLVISITLLLPVCTGWGIEWIPSSSPITVKNELGGTSLSRRDENCLNSYTEETCH